MNSTSSATDVVIDNEVIESLKTQRGGYTAKAVHFIMGCNRKMEKGWARKHIGETRSRHKYILLLEQLARIDERRQAGIAHGDNFRDFRELSRTATQPKIEAVLHFDGSVNPNPGPSSGGFVHRIRNGKMIEGSEAFGEGTCNSAEYRALLIGLRAAIEEGVTDIEIYGDSMIVIGGVKKGPWKKGKPHLEKLKAEAIELLKHFAKFELIWIPREENEDAHQLSVG